MKTLLSCLIIISVLSGCSSVEKFNKQLNVLIPAAQLKSDVDYAYNTLKKYQPQLYWYISKKDLDYKFDSLKSTIVRPMTSRDFYFKLSPVVASIRNGHNAVYEPEKRLEKKEFKEVKLIGLTPFNAFKLELIDDKLFIIRNLRKDSCLKLGTEIVAVNGEKPQDIFNKYKTTFSADGFNQTYQKCWLYTNYSNYYYRQYGITDSVVCQLRYNDSVWTASLKRRMADSLYKTEDKKKTEEKKYDVVSKTRNKNLKFLEADSSVALLTLKSFNGGGYKSFYKNCFKLLKVAKSKTLIIDLRYNGGGSINDVHRLYSYLHDSDFYFLNKSYVSSRWGPLRIGDLSNQSFFKRVGVIFEIQYRLLKCLMITRDTMNNYIVPFIGSRVSRPNRNRFQGAVYVLINGGSYSASSLLSSNLKGTKRAIFVGEETAGDYNGTVAGWMPEMILPNSQLTMRYGLCFIQPAHLTSTVGRGIFPDVEIKPSLTDKINKSDPVLNWVLEEIKK